MEKSDDDSQRNEKKVKKSSSDTDDNNQPSSSTTTFHKLNKLFKKRSYRKKIDESAEEENADSSNEDSDDEACDAVAHIRKISKLMKIIHRNVTDDSEDEESHAESKADGSDTESGERSSNEWPIPSDGEEGLTVRKPEPSTVFCTVNEMMQRQIGQSKNFQRKFYGSIRTVERLKFLHSLNEHKGCVNTVEFNERGDLLVSGSDDLAVCVWNWATGKKRNSYESGHRNNIFQASWLPRDDSTMMVTCASDGQVRLLDLVWGTTRKLASHQGACNKFALHPETPYVALSVGDDGKILSIDIRADEATKLVTMRAKSFTLQLYTIHSNPRNSYEFCVGGHTGFVTIFDRRKASSPLSKLCPIELRGNNRVHITSVTYNHDGTEILASSDAEDIYLFDTLMPHPSGDYAHKYCGHRNSKTIKGVNYFGPKSEFIVSGSDCGHIFFWEKNSETVVQCLRGDAQGVVNCIKPHPSIPILASSGLDDDVKIWGPCAFEPSPMTDLQELIESNLTERAEARSSRSFSFDSEVLNSWTYPQSTWSFARNYLRYLHTNSSSGIRRSVGLLEDEDLDDDDDDDDVDD